MGKDIRLRLNKLFPFVFSPLFISFKFPLDGVVGLITLDEDREGLKRKERDLSMNFASPSKLAIELVEDWLEGLNNFPSFDVVVDVLVRRPIVEICN